MTNEKTGRVATDMPNSYQSAGDKRSGGAANSRVNFVLVTGRRFSLTSTQIWHLMTDRHFLIFFAICSVLIAYLYPVTRQPRPPWWEFVIAFLPMELFFYGALVGTFLLMEKSCRGWPALVIPVPLITLIALLATLSFARTHAPFLLGPAWSTFRSLTEEFVLNYFVILNLEVLFSIFVLPRTKVFLQTIEPQHDIQPVPDPAEAPAEPQTAAPPQSVTPQSQALPVPNTQQLPTPPSATPPPPATVHFGSHSWPVSALRLIRAEEHYIRVVTDHQEVLIRYRLSDAVSQLPEEAGMRVHRSYWLSYDAVVHRAPLPDSRLLLTLWNGTTVTVPRAHRKKLEAAFAARPCPADPAKGG